MGEIYDHTAPWHCSLVACSRCHGKPSYGEWWVAVSTRKIEPRPKLVRRYPRCARCDRSARYETPAHRGGPWGYWCDEHLPSGMLAIGYRLRLDRGHR